MAKTKKFTKKLRAAKAIKAVRPLTGVGEGTGPGPVGRLSVNHNELAYA